MIPAFSLVAIHGIGAHPLNTWAYWNPETKATVNWLKDGDMLHQDLPQTRIMIFGYRSDWKGTQALNVTVSEVAKRLLDCLVRARKVVGSTPSIQVEFLLTIVGFGGSTDRVCGALRWRISSDESKGKL